MELQKRLTVDEAAVYAKKGTAAIYGWIGTGFLPATKRLYGRGYEVSVADLDWCLAQPKRGTSPRRVPLRPWHLKARDKRRASVRQYSGDTTSRQGA